MTNYSTFEVECSDCDGAGYIYEGRMGINDPSTDRVTCSTCGGAQFVPVSDEDYYDHAVTAMKEARERYHRFKGSFPLRAGKAHAASLHWLEEAKKARAAVLQSDHAGGAHINNLEK